MLRTIFQAVKKDKKTKRLHVNDERRAKNIDYRIEKKKYGGRGARGEGNK